MMREFQTHGVASPEYWCVVQSFEPSRGSRTVSTPTALEMSARFILFGQVYGFVPAMTVVGPLMTFGGSLVRCVHIRMERSVVGEDDAATIPTLPLLSTPIVGNRGFTFSLAIFAVCTTLHAVRWLQSRSAQNMM